MLLPASHDLLVCFCPVSEGEEVVGESWLVSGPTREGEIGRCRLPPGERGSTAGPRGEGPDVPVLVVDDQAVFRDVASDVVRATPGMTLVGVAASGEEAIAAVEALSPRLVLMDKRMPGIGGVKAAHAIRARHPDVLVIVVSVEHPSAEVLEASGAVAFLPKRELSPRVLGELWATYGA